MHPFTIVTVPKDVEIYIDGQLLGSERTFHFSSGKYDLVVKKEGYHDAGTVVSIPEQKLVTFTLKKK